MTSHKTVRESLQYVSTHPQPSTEDQLEAPMWELVGRTLFTIAMSPNEKVRGSMARATRAQRMISDRLVGLRRAGTKVAVRRDVAIEFHDLTAAEVAGPADEGITL